MSAYGRSNSGPKLDRNDLLRKYDSVTLAVEEHEKALATLMREYRASCDPAPFTSERALIERIESIAYNLRHDIDRAKA